MLRRSLLGGLSGLPMLAIRPVQAATYPDRPVRIVVPFAPGGISDLVARVVAASLSTRLGKAVVVENRPGGAAGILGTEYVARSTPDGYTLLLGSPGSLTVGPHLYPGLNYDTLRDFAPVSRLVTTDFVLVVHPSFPATTPREYAAYAKAHPGQVTYASAGLGSTSHLFGAWFALMAGLDLMHVPYRGAGPAANDLVAGVVNSAFDQVPSSIGHVQGGRLRALATSGAQRSRMMPDVPTMAESGFPDYVGGTWVSLLAPAGTPAEIVEVLNGHVVATLGEDTVRERLAALGADAAPTTAAGMLQILRSELQSWGDLVRRANIRVD